MDLLMSPALSWVSNGPGEQCSGEREGVTGGEIAVGTVFFHCSNFIWTRNMEFWKIFEFSQLFFLLISFFWPFQAWSKPSAVKVQHGGTPSHLINPAPSVFPASLANTYDQPGCLQHFVQQKLLHRWSRWSTDGTWTLFHWRFRTRAQHIWYAARSIFALICLSPYIEGTICHSATLWLRCDVWRTWPVRSFKQPGWFPRMHSNIWLWK